MRSISLEVVRQANPVPDEDVIVNLAVREQTLRKVHETLEARGRVARSRRHRQPRRPRVLVAVLLASLGFAAVALAASGILAGAPYRVPGAPALNHNPGVGTGVTVSGSARLLALRAPDPSGGPPWGMRVLRTTRGLACVQVGRVVNGQLGVLGQDGVAGNDHRFHALAPDLTQLSDCALPDAHQHVFINNETNSDYASGPVFTPSSCARPGQGSRRAMCPARDRRMLAYGLLGPDARSITYLDAGRKVTEATAGPDGAYLVVGPAAPAGTVGLASGSGDLFPGALVVTFKDGRRCIPRRAVSCAEVGYAVTRTPRLHPGRVAVRAMIRRYQRNGKSYADLVVRFRAPVAITNAHLSYALAATLPRACGTIDYANVDRDVRRGARVALAIPELPGNCPGTATANLQLTRTNAYLAGPDPVIASLATFRFRLPRTTGINRP